MSARFSVPVECDRRRKTQRRCLRMERLEPRQLLSAASPFTVGVYDATAGAFYLRNSNTSGAADTVFNFGAPQAGMLPVAGDWNGDGAATVGVFDPQTSWFSLRDSNSAGAADYVFGYGDPALSASGRYVLLMGDWNGDGTDSVGLYDRQSAIWFLRNSNTIGVADITFGYGVPESSWTPLVGDWNGDGVTTIGFYDATNATYYLRNSNSTGMADYTFGYGVPGSTWTAIMGDWDANGTSTIGFYDPASAHWFLRNSNDTGMSDVDFGFGPAEANWRPLVGCWSASTPPTIVAPASANADPVVGMNAALSVLGADAGGEASLRYTWTATTLPAGAPAPLFSVNGSNAAKNTSVSFGKAGTYEFSATVVDAGGLATDSHVTVQVSQTLTGITLVPGNISLATNASQQFSANGVDQFGHPLAVQPPLVWTASGGTISAGGLYRAPASAGVATVSAAHGSISGAAQAAVLGGLALQDSNLAGLAQTLSADGSVGRADMIRMLRAVGDDGTVSAVELGDLGTVLSFADSLAMPGEVQVLAADVINGNLANADYQGLPLGNLQAGSTAAQLNTLIDKWFFGTDHPAVGSYVYQPAGGALFVNGPTYSDMRQGLVNDCYLIAALGALAQSSPATIQEMFIDNGDDTWTVRFYTSQGVADYVTVDRLLPVNAGGYLVYSGKGLLASNATTELWLPLVEKAYAQWNETGKAGRDGKNAYTSLQNGWMQNVDAQALGYKAASYYGFSATYQQTLIDAVAGNKAVTVSTNSAPGNGLFASHAYVVSGYDSASGTFTLYNPLGASAPSPLTYAQLQASCTCLAIADPTLRVSAATPITTTSSSAPGSALVVDPQSADYVWASLA